MLLHRVGPPALELVEPGLDREEPTANTRQRNAGPPAIIAGLLHADLAPAALAAEPAPHAGPEMHMAVHENVGFDFQRIAHDAFRRMAAAVDLWLQAFDNDAPAPEIGRGPGNQKPLPRPSRLKRPSPRRARKKRRSSGSKTSGRPGSKPMGTRQGVSSTN